jgi:hypothetical protein
MSEPKSSRADDTNVHAASPFEVVTIDARTF